MSKSTLAGAAALLCAPVLVSLAVLTLPTLSDDASKQVTALTDHRGAMLAGMTLQAIAIVLMIVGIAWLALTLAPRAPRLALAGGVLALAGSLVILFEAGIQAAAPAVVHGIGAAQATATLDRIHSSAAVAALEPFSTLGVVGFALLGFAAVKAGAPRWAAAAIALGSAVDTAGFATGTKVLAVSGFVVLLAGLAPVTVRLAPRARSFGGGQLDAQPVR